MTDMNEYLTDKGSVQYVEPFESSKTEPLVLDREDAQLFLEALSKPVVFNDAMTKALKAHGEVVQSGLPRWSFDKKEQLI